MISILIVEDQLDHQLYLNTIISSDAGFKNLGIIRLGAEAIREIPRLKPDIVLMDIGLPDMSGIECISKLKPVCPDVNFLVCTVNEEDEHIFEALKVGAKGYILKKSKPYQIIDAIKELNDGETPLSSSIARKILNHLPQHKAPVASADYDITPREASILKLLAKGYSYQEVSDALFISIKTMKWHIYNIYKKLHADNRTEALNKFFGTEN